MINTINLILIYGNDLYINLYIKMKNIIYNKRNEKLIY